MANIAPIYLSNAVHYAARLLKEGGVVNHNSDQFLGAIWIRRRY